MAKLQTPRAAWIDTAMQALASGGPEAVRVEALAASLGVSKGGFYWHFKDRPALLEEMLDSWERAGTDAVIAQIESDPGDPRAQVRRLFALAPSADFAVELAIREWSRRDDAVAARLRRIDDRRIDFLRSLFARFCATESDAEARSLLAYSLLIGSYFVVGGHGARSRSESLGLAVDRLLAGPWG